MSAATLPAEGAAPALPWPVELPKLEVGHPGGTTTGEKVKKCEESGGKCRKMVDQMVRKMDKMVRTWWYDGKWWNSDEHPRDDGKSGEIGTSKS